MNTPIFEYETCGRCHGTGHHSYCQMYGSICFGCSGRKVKLTKRGQAAQDMYTRLASKRADQLTIGDIIWVEASPFSKGGWSAVISLKRDEFGSRIDKDSNGRYSSLDAIVIETEKLIEHTSNDQIKRIRQSGAQRSAILDLCMAYQRSLNKSGKPDKILARIMGEIAYA